MIMDAIMNETEIIYIDILVVFFKRQQRAILRYTGKRWSVLFNSVYIAVGIKCKCQRTVNHKIHIIYSMLPFYFFDLVSFVCKDGMPVYNIGFVYKFNYGWFTCIIIEI